MLRGLGGWTRLVDWHELVSTTNTQTDFSEAVKIEREKSEEKH